MMNFTHKKIQGDSKCKAVCKMGNSGKYAQPEHVFLYITGIILRTQKNTLPAQ